MTIPRKDVLGRIAVLDPERDRTPQVYSADDPGLAEILGEPQGGVRGGRRWQTLAVASVAIAAVGVVGFGIVLHKPVAAFASWAPVPTALHADEDPSAACPKFAHEIVSSDETTDLLRVPVTATVIDVRGEFGYVISTSDRAYSECFLVDGEVIATSDGVSPQPFTTPGPEEITVLQHGTASWSEGAEGVPGALTSLYGQAGDDVTAITLTSNQSPRVEASVQDGWWAAWVPGKTVLAPEAEIATRDGSTRLVDIRLEDHYPVDQS